MFAVSVIVMVISLAVLSITVYWGVRQAKAAIMFMAIVGCVLIFIGGDIQFVGLGLLLGPIALYLFWMIFVLNRK